MAILSLFIMTFGDFVRFLFLPLAFISNLFSFTLLPWISKKDGLPANYLVSLLFSGQ